jgi:chromosome segregation ATPase
MADDAHDLTLLVTRGFAGMADQLRDRDDKVIKLSDRMIGVELKLDQLKETLGKVETEISKAEIERIKSRLEVLEETNKEVKQKQAENARWIKGLIASVIVLLLGVLFNFLRASIK